MYAVGGRDGPMGLREVESFDPHTNRWTQCASMLKRRGSVAVAVCNDFLYAIGGYDQIRTNKNILRHDDGERYDPRCNQWTLITSFSRPKEALGIATVGRRLYIVGGFDGKVLNEMECYDTETEQWERVGITLVLFLLHL
jgi:kelch-like protein 1/4/5